MIRPACLVVIDGWGISDNNPKPGVDAIAAANTPVMDHLSKLTATHLSAHGLSVGLPDGLMGNSEVGHLNIGAGRVVYQDIVRIDLACAEEFENVENIQACFTNAIRGNGRLHFMGLISDGGVHSHIRHLFGLLKAAKKAGVPECWVHFFADGRDTPPKSTTVYLGQLLEFMNEQKYGRLASICGRYYAMDRDKRWERIRFAADMLAHGKNVQVVDDPIKAVEERYSEGETDEFLKPILCAPANECCVRENDSVFLFDFRADRMREISQVLGQIEPGYSAVNVVMPKLNVTSMTSYKAEFPFRLAFPPQKMDNVLAEWLSKNDISQYHCAETEKYAHVTFFFNGGREIQFEGEIRSLIPSPKVATYDLKPEMSAMEVGQDMANAIRTKKASFIMCNFAPPDMVGHTGVYEAAIKAVEATDKAIGQIYEACKEAGYALFVTADHGNAEKMKDETTGQPHTAHTTAKVPFYMACPNTKDQEKWTFSESDKEALCDVAPTVLDYMGLVIPQEMTGKSLFNSKGN